MEHQNALPTGLQPQKKSNPTPVTPQEENRAVANPACALKVNIKCCNGCEVKAKKKLQKLKGVDSITYDAEQGILRISGNVNPTVVIQKLAELGKKAELLRVDNKNPPTNGAGSASASASGDHGGDVPIPTNIQSSNNKTSSRKWFWCFSRKNKVVKTPSSNADGGANKVSTKFDGGANNVSRQIQGPGLTNFHGYVAPAPAPAPATAPAPGPYYMPPIYSMPMPPYYVPPHNGFFPSRPPPRMNPMIHYTNYTNYEDNHREFL